ncbi:MAG: hypothetical protein C00003105_00604 [ANME-2 cluster archaeon HR1]|nr:MAG: hypothetical protein C00003105_00604 [ANME-2 cluster archaeon HR1]
MRLSIISFYKHILCYDNINIFTPFRSNQISYFKNSHLKLTHPIYSNTLILLGGLRLMVVWMLPSFTQRTSASKIISISGLITFTSVVAYYPIPPASHQSVTRLGAGFSSEVVASLSSGWIFTNWRV